MKRILFVAGLLALAGCAAQQNQWQPSPKMIEIDRYAASQKPRAEKGELRWSDYYEGLYQRQLSANYPPQILAVVNKLLRLSQQYEHGEISQEDFQFSQRDLRAQAQIIGRQLQAEQRANETARQQANMALAARIMQNRPLIPPVQFTPMTPARTTAAPTTQLQPFQPATPSAIAYWTGQQRQVQTVTYQSGWTCEYRYLSQTFWRTFVGSCPSSIQVQ